MTTIKTRNRKNTVKPTANPTLGPPALGLVVGPSVGDGVGVVVTEDGKPVDSGDNVVVGETMRVVVNGIGVLRLAITVEADITGVTDILAIRDALRVATAVIADVI